MDLDTLYKEELILLKKLVESDGTGLIEYQEILKRLIGRINEKIRFYEDGRRR